MTKIRRYTVLTPFDNVHLLAGICALHGLDVDVCASSGGVLVVKNVPVPVYDEWDIRQLTGELPEDQEPENPSENGAFVAGILSRLSPYGVVLIDVNTIDQEDGFDTGISGSVTARRYLAGEPGEEISSGLLLNGLGVDVERIVLGENIPDDVHMIATADISREELERMAGMMEKSDEPPAQEDN